MLTRPYAISLAMTALTAVSLPLCWGEAVSMLMWCALAATYAIYIVGLFIDLEYIELSCVATLMPDELPGASDSKFKNPYVDCIK